MAVRSQPANLWRLKRSQSSDFKSGNRRAALHPGGYRREIAVGTEEPHRHDRREQVAFNRSSRSATTVRDLESRKIFVFWPRCATGTPAAAGSVSYRCWYIASHKVAFMRETRGSGATMVIRLPYHPLDQVPMTMTAIGFLQMILLTSICHSWMVSQPSRSWQLLCWPDGSQYVFPSYLGELSWPVFKSMFRTFP